MCAHFLIARLRSTTLGERPGDERGPADGLEGDLDCVVALAGIATGHREGDRKAFLQKAFEHEPVAFLLVRIAQEPCLLKLYGGRIGKGECARKKWVELEIVACGWPGSLNPKRQ